MGERVEDTEAGDGERWLQGVFQLFGLGKELWRSEDPDEYVCKLREGWDERDLS